MVRCFTCIWVALLMSVCNNTEISSAHDNPLDRIYDSGNFRIGLIADAKSATVTTLSWSNVYHKSEGQLSDSNLKLNPTASIFRSAAAPSTADLNAVKSATGLSAAFTGLSGCTITVASASYAGTCDITTSTTGYYIIQFNYKFTDKSSVVTSGILYSNFAAVP